MKKTVKRFKSAILIFSTAFTASMLAVMYTPLANIMARPLLVEPGTEKADLIAVLGGGMYENGSLGKTSGERMITGMLLYKKGRAPKIIFSGGSILQPSKKIMRTLMRVESRADSGSAESELMKETASSLGLPPGDMAVDAASTNTYGNIKEIKAYMGRNGLKTCIIVTSPTHMRRASMIARKAGLSFIPAPSPDYTRYRTSPFERLSLFREAAWEYAGLVIYRIYGYI